MPLVDTLPLRPGTAQWSLWSTTARLVVTRHEALTAAEEFIRAYLDEVDAACSRFRADSELSRAQLRAGSSVRVSPLLADLVEAALTAAARTDGLVDPTVGAWLCDLGYDRDFGDLDRLDGTEVVIRAGPPNSRLVLHRRPDWRGVSLRRDGFGDAWLTVPAGVRLDLGATAKAYAADRCAAQVRAQLDTGVLVSLGGDIATAGPAPRGGWRILVRDRPGDPSTTVNLPAGTAIATSSTVSRRWAHRGVAVHHIVDPRTGQPASTRWCTATVVAPDCATANTFSTAALIHGDAAVRWLRGTGHPARLVDTDARVVTCGGWPTEQSTSDGGARR
jgi:thiamine biosynthesis lipoprotein